MQLFIQQVINGLGQGALIALFAVGFGLVFAKLGVLNAAHGTFATGGTLIAFKAHTELGVPLWLCVPLGALGGGAIGVVVDTVCFAPIRARAGEGGGALMSTLIASVGAWIALLSLAQIVLGPHSTGYPPDALLDDALVVSGVRILPMTAINIAVAVAAGVGVAMLLARTQFGATVRALGHDGKSVAIIGANTRATAAGLAFIAAGLAGLAGALAGMTYNDISFDAGETLLLTGFAAAVLGGFGSTYGALTGGFLIGILQVLSAQYISSGFRDAITFGLLILLLVVRPQGLFGEPAFERA